MKRVLRTASAPRMHLWLGLWLWHHAGHSSFRVERHSKWERKSDSLVLVVLCMIGSSSLGIA